MRRVFQQYPVIPHLTSTSATCCTHGTPPLTCSLFLHAGLQGQVPHGTPRQTHGHGHYCMPPTASSWSAGWDASAGWPLNV